MFISLTISIKITNFHGAHNIMIFTEKITESDNINQIKFPCLLGAILCAVSALILIGVCCKKGVHKCIR